MTPTVTELTAPVDAAQATPRRGAPKLPLGVTAAAYLEHLHAEVERLRPLASLAEDRGRRINAALGLINQFRATDGAGWTAVLLADLRLVLDSHRDPQGGQP